MDGDRRLNPSALPGEQGTWGWPLVAVGKFWLEQLTRTTP
jgi:hypothetical protein